MSSFQLKNWPVFTVVEDEFISKIRMAVVYGNVYSNALVVTNDKMVYTLGTNVNREADDICDKFGPKKVEVLCGKNIKSFAVGRGHSLALTDQGQVYSWGRNMYGQLGTGCFIDSILPVLIQHNIKCKHIVDIACGYDHSVALTNDGKVYSWGYISDSQNVPSVVQFDSFDKSIISIACGKEFSIAITENGEVYSWGNNNYGQLGIGDYNTRLKPCRVTTLLGIKIKKVVCGTLHTVALSSTRDLYVWGSNQFGELGIESSENCYPTPKQLISKEMGKVLDIAASHSNSLSIAITGKDGNAFVWGMCLGQCIKRPTRTPLKCVNEAFAYYAPSCSTYEPLIFTDNEVVSNIIDCFSNAFNDQTTSDLVIKVQGNPIYVHKAILKIRCPYLKTKFEECWNENNESVIEIEEFSNDVYEAFLQYLYTNEINLPVEDVAELYNLANTYSMDTLKDLCMFTLKEEINVKNAIFLYKKAIKYKAKEMEEFCFSFSTNCITLTMNNLDFTELDDSEFKSFVVKAIQKGAFVE